MSETAEMNHRDALPGEERTLDPQHKVAIITLRG